jgi:phosphoserine aminotransferase
VARLDLRALGRSHRSALGKEPLGACSSETARILGLPAGYRVGVVPASDTGAVELALWSLLGPRGVDMLAWESFGSGWVKDVVSQLKLQDVTRHEAGYGQPPDLGKVNFDHDVVFTWNGTTSGVRVPDGDWIADDRAGLAICDATSAVFAMDLPWHKLDVVTYSWQKVLGGEGAHGMLILSPRAARRLESYTPPWPLPKIFRLTSGGKLMEDIFAGSPINTPSMLCVADYLDALAWCDRVGGVAGTIARSQANLKVVEDFVAAHPWIHFLAQAPETRSNTSVCLTLDLPADKVKALAKLLETRAWPTTSPPTRRPARPAHLVRRDGGAKRPGGADALGGGYRQVSA